MKKSKLILDTIKLPIDFLGVFAGFLLAYKIRPITDLIPGVHYHFSLEQLPVFDEFLRFTAFASLFLIILFIFNGLYSIKSTERLGKTFLKIVYLISVWLMIIIAYYFLVVHELFFSRIALAHIWIFSIFFITAGRVIILALQQWLYYLGIGQTRILFVGVNPFADNAFMTLRKDRRFKVLGALGENFESRKKEALKVIGKIAELESIVKQYRVDEIILTDSHLKDLSPSDLLSFCRAHHVHYYLIPEILHLQSVNVEMEMIDNVPLISLKQTRLEGWGRVSKRIFDIFFSSVLVLLLIPLWIVVAILIKLDSKGPVFYKSKRKYREKIFHVYKFRSMVVDAEAKRAALLHQNERKGPLFKIKHDPRVTRLGRFLRKTSIDELPQLFNVLIGNMSLVGPRPHLPEEVDQYKTHHLRVFAIKPGVTGLAQINGRSNLDFEEEVKLDFYYIENWSFLLDLKIILKSVAVVFRADGH